MASIMHESTMTASRLFDIENNGDKSMLVLEEAKSEDEDDEFFLIHETQVE